MKTAESKTTSKAASTAAKTSTAPFFSQEPQAESAFFGGQKAESDSFFSPQTIQPKLKIGAPNDHYEQQADAVADQVVQKLSQPQSTTTNQQAITNNSSTPSVNGADKGGSIQKLSSIQSKSETNQPEEKLQKKDDIESVGEQIQKKPIFDSATEPPPDDALQRKGDGNFIQRSPSGEGEASPDFSSQLASSKGGGTALPPETQQQMGNAIGADFSGVRIHTGSEAANMSENIGAQAFTHGNDVYFNEGKYNPSSTEGSHLLAHELTHTVQQGAAKSAVQKKVAVVEKKPINDLPASKKGSITTGPNVITLFNFELKSYAANSPHLSSGPYEKPKGDRPKSDKHKKAWEKEVKDSVFEKVKSLSKGAYDEEQLYEFYVKGERQGVGIVGNIKQISNEMLVPPIDRQGNVRLFDVEHIIDWQILGGSSEVDKIDNLLLLDASSNRGLGNIVKGQIKDHIVAVLDSYRDRGGENVPKSMESAEVHYKILFKNFTIGSKRPGIFLRKENLTTSKDNPITADNFVLKRYLKDGNHFLLKTSEGRVSYELPYIDKPQKAGSYEIDMDIVKDGKNKKLTGLYFTPLPEVKGIKTAIEIKKSKIIIPDEEEPNVYKIDSKALATSIKSLFGFRYASPIVLDDNIQTFPLIAHGKVVTEKKFLEGIDIGFDVNDKDYRVYAAITSDKLNGKFPKPFNIDACSLILSATKADGFSFSGLVEFSLGKFGSGEVVASVAEDGFALKGIFDFNSKYFNPAQLSVEYKKGEWLIGGKLGIQQGIIPGIKDAHLEAQYTKGAFSIAGLAHLSVPGIDAITLAAQFDEKGNFAFTAGVDLKAMTGIKSGRVKATITSKEGEEGINLRVEGKATPDLPKVPNLNAELDVLYDKGIFKVSATVKYKEGRFDGTITAGVTNQTVDDKGNPQGAPNEKGDVIVFGYGQLTVDLFKGMKGTISVRLTPDKEVLIGGSIELKNLKPFGEGYHPEPKELLKFPTLEIPLIGIPGMSVSAFIKGGVYFKFNWDPLVLKLLKVEFKETNINELDKAQLDITGSVGSIATAEVYMSIDAGIKARVLIATLSGSLGGEAGLGVTAEAGGDIQASWDMQKGLQLKEIAAHLDVTPKAMFRLTGKVSVDLDLWITSVNLYYHKWILAEQELDMGDLALKAHFPIKFDENGDVIKPELDQIGLDKPNFDGDQGKDVLNKGINGDAEKELAAKKEEIRATVKHDLRDTSKESVTPTEYTKKMKKKYKDSPELQEFVIKTIEEEARLIEYEEFEKRKNMIKQSALPLATKLQFVDMFAMFNHYVTDADTAAFKTELVKIEEDKKLKEEQDRQAEEQAKKEQLSQERAQKNNASKSKGNKKAAIKPKEPVGV